MPVLKQTATCFTPPCMCRYSCIFSELILREISNGLSFRVLERENRKAPNQHRCFSGWLEELGNTAPPPLPVRRFHIHSKTACRGFKSFCPCQKSQVSLLRYLIFFVSVRQDLATRCGRRPACGACRGGLQPGGLRPGPTEAAAETSPSALFLGFPIRSHLFSTVPIPSSTQNAPGFAFFWLNRVRFALFDLF